MATPESKMQQNYDYGGIYFQNKVPDGYVNITESINILKTTDPHEVQKIAASQIELLSDYYNTVLRQANRSFNLACISAGVGLLVFLGAIVYNAQTSDSDKSVAYLAALGGTLVEVIAGINFVLYGKAQSQLEAFHQKLYNTQNYLLSNSICEALEGENREKTRSVIATYIATSYIKKTGTDQSGNQIHLPENMPEH